jgi:hypothetical protein
MTEARVVLPTTVTPIHYSLELTTDFTLLSFDGVEVVDVLVSGEIPFRLCPESDLLP